jgi:HSP20 family protein
MSKTADKPATSQPDRAPQTPTPSAVAPARRELPAPWVDPFAHLRRFNEEFDRVFSGFGFGRGLAFPNFEAFELPKRLGEMANPIWSPQVEVLEREGMIVVRADLPGVAKDDVSVEIEDGVVAISGERKTQTEEKREKYFRSERSYGSFCRSFRLPDGADASRAKASFKDGVLEVEIPAPAKPKSEAQKVEIQETKNE